MLNIRNVWKIPKPQGRSPIMRRIGWCEVEGFGLHYDHYNNRQLLNAVTAFKRHPGASGSTVYLRFLTQYILLSEMPGNDRKLRQVPENARGLEKHWNRQENIRYGGKVRGTAICDKWIRKYSNRQEKVKVERNMKSGRIIW